MRMGYILFLVLAAVTIPASATLIVGTDLPSIPPGGEGDVDDTQAIVQSFTITTPSQVTGISVQMTGFGSDSFTLWLTNAIGTSATPANVLLQSALTFPNTGGFFGGATTVSVITNLFLTDGTYYLVESSTITALHQGQGWINTTTLLPSAFGTVGQPGFVLGPDSFPPSSAFRATQPPMAFQITGTPVPEPQSAGFVMIGLLALSALKLKMSRSK